MLALLLAAGAGVATVAAPCVLPMLPILLGVGIGGRAWWRPPLIALGFTASFAGVTLVFASASSLLGVTPDGLRQAAIVLLLGFGLLMLWPRPFERLAARFGFVVDRAAGWGGQGPLGGFVLGLSLGLVWTPCAGPVLGSILTLIATAERPAWAATLMLAYAAGAALPMLAIAYGGQWASRHVRRLAPYAARLQQAFGALVIAVALAIQLDLDAAATLWLSR